MLGDAEAKKKFNKVRKDCMRKLRNRRKKQIDRERGGGEAGAAGGAVGGDVSDSDYGVPPSPPFHYSEDDEASDMAVDDVHDMHSDGEVEDHDRLCNYEQPNEAAAEAETIRRDIILDLRPEPEAEPHPQVHQDSDSDGVPRPDLESAPPSSDTEDELCDACKKAFPSEPIPFSRESSLSI